jgi:FHS family L-fucose permease-like MFS transporter
VLTIMTPAHLLPAFGVAGFGRCAAAFMMGPSNLSLAGVVAAGFGFANIWPMLFSITVEERPDACQRTQRPHVHGHFRRCHRAAPHGLVAWTCKWEAMAFVVPAACFAYLLLLSLKGGKKPAAAKA